jgi:ketosteroid isomerase-like protein
MRFGLAHRLGFVALVSSAACAPPAPPAPPVPKIDLAAERDALTAADKAWNDAFNKSESPVEAFLGAMLDDARFQFADSPPAVGKDAIRAALTAMASTPGFHVEWAPSVAVVAASGDLGYTVGALAMKMDGPDGKPVAVDGHYVTIWKKVDGAWKVIVDTGGPAGPPKPVG